MDEIFKGKKKVKPDVLLSTNTIDIIEEKGVQSGSSDTRRIPETPKISIMRRKTPLTSKNTVLEQMRRDRKEYYEGRLALGKERKELLRERNEFQKSRVCPSCSKNF